MNKRKYKKRYGWHYSRKHKSWYRRHYPHEISMFSKHVLDELTYDQKVSLQLLSK